MNDVRQKYTDLAQKSLNVSFGDITLVNEGYRVVVHVVRSESETANFTVCVPKSGKQARSQRWDKTPTQIKAEAQRRVAAFCGVISTL
jgi:hypothetical protein